MRAETRFFMWGPDALEHTQFRRTWFSSVMSVHGIQSHSGSNTKQKHPWIPNWKGIKESKTREGGLICPPCRGKRFSCFNPPTPQSRLLFVLEKCNSRLCGVKLHPVWSCILVVHVVWSQWGLIAMPSLHLFFLIPWLNVCVYDLYTLAVSVDYKRQLTCQWCLVLLCISNYSIASEASHFNSFRVLARLNPTCLSVFFLS